MGQYDVRPYKSGDETQIIELLHKVFNGWPKFNPGCSRLEHWRWKYIDNPVNVGVTTCVSVNDGKIVGCMHDFQGQYHLFREGIIAGKGADLAVHPKHRRQGLYSRMVDILNESRVKNRVELTTFISDNPIVIERTKRRGSILLSPATTMVKINDIDLHLKHNHVENPWIKKLGMSLLKTLNKPKQRVIKRSPDLRLEEKTSFGNEVDEYYNHVKTEYDFISVKYRDFLNWRYCDNRGGNYRPVQAWQSGELVGYIVSRIVNETQGYPVGYIYEFQFIPGYLDVANSLLRETLDHLDSKSVNMIIAWALRGQSIIKIFNEAGF
ncbi:GNAT family N-acetyltransferase, partial [Candidatus Bathyarchaeota archaeon]|nr:GNAT family N-acetyltransferase [Candidatus Bathyarchaeota archaeon]